VDTETWIAETLHRLDEMNPEALRRAIESLNYVLSGSRIDALNERMP